MKNTLSQTSYEYIIRELFAEATGELVNQKINPPFPLLTRWTTGWIDSIEGPEAKICFTIDHNTEVFPYLMIETSNILFINRFSPFLEFETLLKKEVEIFNNFTKNIAKYNLTILDIFSEDQANQLASVLNKKHIELFNKPCKIDITFSPVPPEITIEELELIIKENQ